MLNSRHALRARRGMEAIHLSPLTETTEGRRRNEAPALVISVTEDKVPDEQRR